MGRSRTRIIASLASAVGLLLLVALVSRCRHDVTPEQERAIPGGGAAARPKGTLSAAGTKPARAGQASPAGAARQLRRPGGDATPSQARGPRSSDAPQDPSAGGAMEGTELAFGRGSYPTRSRTCLPAGTGPRDFVDSMLAQITALAGPRLSSVEEGTRRVAAEDLLAETCMGVPECLTALMEAAQGADRTRRDAAILLLGRLPQPRAVQFLLDTAAASADPEVREATVHSLGQDQGWNVRGIERVSSLGGPSGPICDSRVFDALLAAARMEKNPDVLFALTYAVSWGLYEGTLEEGPDRLAHPEGMHFATETLAFLLDLARSSPDAGIRAGALSALRRAKSAAATALLVDTARGGATAQERSTALNSLRDIDAAGIDVIAPILEAMRDPDRRIQFAAISASLRAGRDEEVFEEAMRIYRVPERHENSANALDAGIANLLSNRTRFGAPAEPLCSRALDEIEKAVAKDEGQEIQDTQGLWDLLQAVRTRSGDGSELPPSDRELLAKLEGVLRERWGGNPR